MQLIVKHTATMLPLSLWRRRTHGCFDRVTDTANSETIITGNTTAEGKDFLFFIFFKQYYTIITDPLRANKEGMTNRTHSTLLHIARVYERAHRQILSAYTPFFGPRPIVYNQRVFYFCNHTLRTKTWFVVFLSI